MPCRSRLVILRGQVTISDVDRRGRIIFQDKSQVHALAGVKDLLVKTDGQAQAGFLGRQRSYLFIGRQSGFLVFWQRTVLPRWGWLAAKAGEEQSPRGERPEQQCQGESHQLAQEQGADRTLSESSDMGGWHGCLTGQRQGGPEQDRGTDRDALLREQPRQGRGRN